MARKVAAFPKGCEVESGDADTDLLSVRGALAPGASRSRSVPGVRSEDIFMLVLRSFVSVRVFIKNYSLNF